MMQILRNLLQKTNSKPPLGRWTIERCNTKLDQKIDLANEDHCGPCGNHAHRMQRDQELNRTTANRRQSCSARNGVPLELTIDHNNHNHQLNYLPVYFPAYTSPTFPPIYPPTHTPTYPNVRVCVPREK